MKFNYKSKKGFTLIELLVVIGILAVLAAIAIPSVAGLIDRANVSADNTNANEMTSAMERFVSEYELYKQDIANGTIKDKNSDGVPDNMDSAQGRVYNVTKAMTRADITALENTGLNGLCINKDTKYPENCETARLVITNYEKTSSSTFEPKQSNKNYYYSPDCGTVVCSETDEAKIINLNALIVSGKDAKGNSLSDKTIWINLTQNGYVVDSLPETTKSLEELTWEEVRDIAKANKTNEYNIKVGETKTFLLDGQTKTATIIGINHDGIGTITFIFQSGEFGKMNLSHTNKGGWQNSYMRNYLNTTMVEKMNIKTFIKTSPRYTNNKGENPSISDITVTIDKLFLLSMIECGAYSSSGSDKIIASEGKTYEGFTGGINKRIQLCGTTWWWLRSANPDSDYMFRFIVSSGECGHHTAGNECIINPCFVIG